MHAAINNTKDIVPPIARAAGSPFVTSASLMAWIGVVLLWVSATYLLVRMRGGRLSNAGVQ